MIRVLNTIKWLVIFVLVAGTAFFIYVVVKIDQPMATGSGSQKFTVRIGETTKQVGSDLEKNNLISKSFYFKLYIYFKKQGSKIKAGNYELASSMSIREIADYLVSGKIIPENTKLTVIEGWDTKDIAKALDGLGIMPRKVFLDLVGPGGKDFSQEFSVLKNKPKNVGLEGYLFPDTYSIAKSTRPEDVVRVMLKNFGKKVPAGLKYDDLILASIIEREVGRNVAPGGKLSNQDLEQLSKERRLVSGVFHNRLEVGMALESDATLAYVTGSNSASATLDELKIDSPYNTYKYRGSPPTPISNPSLDSIMAALEPAKTDYLFFVTSPDGTAHFAKTLQEHTTNRAKYLK